MSLNLQSTVYIHKNNSNSPLVGRIIRLSSSYCVVNWIAKDIKFVVQCVNLWLGAENTAHCLQATHFSDADAKI